MLVELTNFRGGAKLHNIQGFECQEASVFISRGQAETWKGGGEEIERSGDNK